MQETNLIKHVFGKRNRRPTLDLYKGDRLIPAESAPSERGAPTR